MAIKSFGHATLDDIKAFKTNNSINLPNDYINFLLKYNGGVIELNDNNVINIEDMGESVNIDVLFGLSTNEAELSVELWLNDYKQDMPQGSIIIGTSYQHGFIILLNSDELSGVYYWDHAYELPFSNDEINTYFLADTFTDFVKGLL